MPDTKDRPETAIKGSELAPKVDGEVINDPFWQAISVVGDLTQVQPQSGQPASENTEIRITYDENTFYLSTQQC